MVDTIAATPINLVLNFVLLSLAFELNMTPLEAAPFLTAAFFVCAVIRKYVIMVFFKNGNEVS
jgi:hypothetical protein